MRGPNIWANFTVLEALVDLGGYDRPSTDFPGFVQRIKEGVPSLIAHRCSLGVPGGFFQRLDEGTYPCHILEHVTLELQSLAGTPVGYGKARETSEQGVYKMVIEFDEEQLARACLKVAWEFLLASLHDQPFDLHEPLERLKDLCGQLCLGPSTRSIVNAAIARGIPVRRLNDASLVQFGWGMHQRRIMAAETDATGAIAQEIAQDKDLTKMILRSAGVPVPGGCIVHSQEEAWEEAQNIGLPVTVKPTDGNQGKGVAVNLTTEEQVKRAYEAATRRGSSAIVEKNVQGKDFRLLVVGERLVAAAARVPAHVIGDGIHTVEELVAKENENPLRGDHHALSLSKIPLDEISIGVLCDQGLTPASVPAAGEFISIRRNANLSTGGTAVDVTDTVHPLNASYAVAAAKCVGLDIAGIDIVAEDITVPLDEQSGKVIEVNAAPGLRMHLEPSEGNRQPVGEAIIDMMFPDGDTGRIPLVAVSGVNGKTTTTRFIAHILRIAGYKTGMVCTDGIYLDRRRLEKGDCSGPQSARSILLNPFVEAAVLETARGGIIREGLGFLYCDVAVVTNIADGDHLDLHDINTLEKLAQVKRVVVDVVTKDGTAVLNADDPLVAGMAEHCKGAVCFFSTSESEVIKRHRAAGGRAVFVREHVIILAEGAQETAFSTLDNIPLTMRGTIRFQVENTLASIGAAWALRLPFEKVLIAAETFIPNFINLPGRFNVVTMEGSTIIVDYGHNSSSLNAIITALGNYGHKNRVAIYSIAGDRLDSDIIEQGRMLGAAFDRVIVYEDRYLRGRRKGEIISLLQQGLADATRGKEVIEVFGSLKAIDIAMGGLLPDTLLLIQADEVDETVEYMRKYFPAQIPLPATPIHA